MEAVNTYNHHSPTNRIEFIEEDIEASEEEEEVLGGGVSWREEALAVSGWSGG